MAQFSQGRNIESIELSPISPFFRRLWIVAESPNNRPCCITDLYGLRKVALEVQFNDNL